MNRATIILGGLLGLSVLVNAVCIVKMGRTEAALAAKPALSKATPDDARKETPSVPKTETTSPKTTPAVNPADPTPTKVPPKTGTAPSFVNDPKVREVLDAQDTFGAYWKELDRVVKARDRLDEASYVKTILAATVDYLELNDLQRSQFAEASNTALQVMADARKDYEAGRKTLPPKGDKNDPAARTAYDNAKNALDAVYDQRVADATANLKVPLDTNRARHAEFIAHMDKWLKNLSRPAQ